MKMGTVFTKNTETIQSFRPCIQQQWLILLLLASSVFLAFTAFGIHTFVGLIIVSVSGLILLFIVLSFCTTRYIITNQGILIRKGPFSRKFKEIPYCDITNISIRQGKIQKRLRIGNLTISAGDVKRVLKSIKNPHKIKELMTKEKASAYERRTLLRKIL